MRKRKVNQSVSDLLQTHVFVDIRKKADVRIIFSRPRLRLNC